MPEREESSQSLASPRAKALARALGVDVRSVPDHSHRGRVVEADVRRFERERAVGPVPSEPQREARRESGKGGAAAPRAAIAAKMSLSAQTVPHFYLDLLADATELKKLREGLLAGMERRAGVRLTYTDLLVKALAAAVAEHAEFNARWTSGGIESGAGVNIGIAAQGKAGLLVVVIRDADKMSLPALATVRHELVERARAGKLRAGDTEGASLTLSNLGAQRIDNFHAIINPPESAILAVGRIAPRPVVVDGAVVARQTVHLSLAVDHRLIDGAAAAAFLGTLAQLVESPYAMLLDSEGRAR